MRKKVTLTVNAGKDAVETPCAVCKRKNTLLFRFGRNSWSCWRPGHIRQVRNS